VARRRGPPFFLTGLRVEVLWHPDPSLRGLKGLVLLERARSLLLQVEGGGRVTVLKRGAVFLVEAPGRGYIRVRGEEVLGDPVDRVKLARRVRGRAGYEGG